MIQLPDLRRAALEEGPPARRTDLREQALSELPEFGRVRRVPWWEAAWDAVVLRPLLAFLLTVAVDLAVSWLLLVIFFN